MALQHPDPQQLWFQITEIFGERTYLQHGVRVAEDDVVFDVGANAGVAAVFFAGALPEPTGIQLRADRADLRDPEGQYGLVSRLRPPHGRARCSNGHGGDHLLPTGRRDVGAVRRPGS